MKSKKRRKARKATSPTQAQNRDFAVPRPNVINPQPLGPKTREQQLAVTQTITQYKGPIPPPQFLESYSEAIPDGGDRVFRLIESESRHIQSQEEIALSAQVSLLKRGQLFAFLIAVAAMSGAVFCVEHSTALAFAFLSLGVGTLAVAFLNMFKTKANGNDKQEK